MTDDDRLSDLLLRWEELFENGESISPESLCKEWPALTEPLRERIHALQDVAWVKEPVQDDTPPTAQPSGGRYRLDRLLAEGGSAQVWRGFDLALQCPVAVKVPRPERFSDEDRVEWFLAEARRVAQLQHPGIVAVHNVTRQDEGVLIVSELINGNDLGRHLLAGPFPVGEALRVTAEVAEALHYAHQQGFVHRDVKPANVLLDQRRQVFVTDFGIAARAEELREHGDDGCGTLPYMSPEQLSGDGTRIDHHTDIYSLGVVLYQLLTGERPFQGDSPATLREQILRQEPRPLRSINPEVPREAERICLRCLAKSPVSRYATAQDVAKDLCRLHARLGRQRWRRALVITLTGITLALATYIVFPRIYNELVDREAWHTARSARDAEVEEGFRAALKRDYEGSLRHVDAALSYWESPQLLCLKAELLLCVKAELHVRLQHCDEAVACCDEALRLAPDYHQAHYVKGLAFEKKGLLAEALACFRLAASHGEREADEKIRRLSSAATADDPHD